MTDFLRGVYHLRVESRGWMHVAVLIVFSLSVSQRIPLGPPLDAPWG